MFDLKKIKRNFTHSDINKKKVKICEKHKTNCKNSQLSLEKWIFPSLSSSAPEESESNEFCILTTVNEKEHTLTMADLKFIVTEVNKLLKTDYNMISFDALPIANLVQILVDVLADFGALTKVKITN